MGKGPKHNNNKSRSNGIFRVAGQNFKTEKKGKPKEVTSKLKLVREIKLPADYFSNQCFLDFAQKQRESQQS